MSLFAGETCRFHSVNVTAEMTHQQLQHHCCSHVVDFISVGPSLKDDLNATVKGELLAFVRRELLTSNWMRALSMQVSQLPGWDLFVSVLLSRA